MLSTRKLRLAGILVVLALVGIVAASAAAKTTRTHGTTITVWVDSPQKPAIVASANAWSAGKGVSVNVLVHAFGGIRSEEHTSELQSRRDLVCRLLLEKKKKEKQTMKQLM